MPAFGPCKVEAGDASSEGVSRMPFGIITSTVVVIMGPHVARTLRPMSAVQWYVDQWAELAAEARASVTRYTDLTAGDVYAGLASAKVVSDLPGRVRVRVADLRGVSRLAAEVAEHLSRQPGINRVVASAATGSVLIFYGRRRYASLELLLA